MRRFALLTTARHRIERPWTLTPDTRVPVIGLLETSISSTGTIDPNVDVVGYQFFLHSGDEIIGAALVDEDTPLFMKLLNTIP